jgi:hypothetical protein
MTVRSRRQIRQEFAYHGFRVMRAALDEAGTREAGQPTDQRPAPDIRLGQKPDLTLSAQNGDVEPGDMVSHQQTAWLQPALDPDLDIQGAHQPSMPPAHGTRQPARQPARATTERGIETNQRSSRQVLADPPASPKCARDHDPQVSFG